MVELSQCEHEMSQIDFITAGFVVREDVTAITALNLHFGK